MLILFLVCREATTFAQGPISNVQWDEAVQILTPQNTTSWFPRVAVDSQDRIHFVFNETGNFVETGGNFAERVFYVRKDGEKWGQYVDIRPPQPDIPRHALAIDNYDTLHFVVGWFRMDYMYAYVDEANSLKGWSEPQVINAQNFTYMKEIAVYKNSLHVVYDDRGIIREDVACSGCADIYYIRSLDRGQSWTKPVNLYPEEDSGASRVQIDIDKDGIIYVAWDEGWDRIKEIFSDEMYGVFMRSDDLGETWSSPTLVTYPKAENSHIAVGSDGNGGVMLVWRTKQASEGFYYMWSIDYGESWFPVQKIPAFFPIGAPAAKFSKLDMTTDSAGHIHLIVVGHLVSQVSLDSSPNLYHFEWDGNVWSRPMPVYEGRLSPQFPSIITHNGNQLYATWTLRESYFDGGTQPNQVWYAHGVSAAPAETPIPLPTLTPTSTPTFIPPTATPTPTYTPTPTPTIDPEILTKPLRTEVLDSIYTDYDEIQLLAMSLLPSILILISTVIIVRLWRRRGP